VLRVLGIAFLGLLVWLGLFFSWAHQQDKSARRYVSAAVPAIFNEWDLDALKQRASEQLSNDPQFRSDAPRMFLMLQRALGKLKRTQDAEGTAGYNVGGTSPAQGTYGDYVIRAEFERGDAELRLLVVRERGAWRIRGFNVNSPVLARPFDPMRPTQQTI
jgi:hypothetical protein